MVLSQFLASPESLSTLQPEMEIDIHNIRLRFRVKLTSLLRVGDYE